MPEKYFKSNPGPGTIAARVVSLSSFLFSSLVGPAATDTSFLSRIVFVRCARTRPHSFLA